MKNKILILGLIVLIIIKLSNISHAQQPSPSSYPEKDIFDENYNIDDATTTDDTILDADLNVHESTSNSENNMNHDQIRDKESDQEVITNSSIDDIDLLNKSLSEVNKQDPVMVSTLNTIAISEKDEASSTKEAMVKIKSQSVFNKFLFGTDKESIIKLNSGSNITRHNIDALNKIINSSINNSDKLSLNRHLQTLKQSIADIDDFTKENNTSFSLFGWW